MFNPLLIILLLCVSSATATVFGTEDVNGYKNTHAVIPVDITDVQTPIPAIIFNVLYDNSVLTVTDVKNGDLTTNWNNPTYCNYVWGTRVALVYDAHNKQLIQKGTTGSVAQLTCSVTGDTGDTSELNFTEIQLAQNYNVASAVAKNSTFTVRPSRVIDWRFKWIRDWFVRAQK